MNAHQWNVLAALLTVAGGVLTIGGLTFSWWQYRGEHVRGRVRSLTARMRPRRDAHVEPEVIQGRAVALAEAAVTAENARVVIVNGSIADDVARIDSRVDQVIADAERRDGELRDFVESRVVELLAADADGAARLRREWAERDDEQQRDAIRGLWIALGGVALDLVGAVIVLGVTLSTS